MFFEITPKGITRKRVQFLSLFFNMIVFGFVKCQAQPHRLLELSPPMSTQDNLWTLCWGSYRRFACLYKRLCARPTFELERASHLKVFCALFQLGWNVIWVWSVFDSMTAVGQPPKASRAFAPWHRVASPTNQRRNESQGRGSDAQLPAGDRSLTTYSRLPPGQGRCESAKLGESLALDLVF